MTVVLSEDVSSFDQGLEGRQLPLTTLDWITVFGVQLLTCNVMALLQVACTCLSTNSVMLARRMFDVCIVDEASQITLPATIGALLKVRPITHQTLHRPPDLSSTLNMHMCLTALGSMLMQPHKGNVTHVLSWALDPEPLRPCLCCCGRRGRSCWWGITTSCRRWLPMHWRSERDWATACSASCQRRTHRCFIGLV